ncbi:protein O-glucosyltransferase 2-like [Tubulanus polymorphus]|uniref:protein O-glucosyltransferase 2-like n=1 Tax=Tubulanus polymorphus TaxID=672921 RepID=UPI003DA40BAF
MDMILEQVLLLFFISCSVDIGLSRRIDPDNSIVWGPGLEAQFSTPARFFYIQAVDDEMNNITESVGKDAFVFTIEEKFSSGDSVGIWTQVLDRQDGSYIARYRLYGSMNDLVLKVKHQGKHVAGSPYLLSGSLHGSNCDCPEPDIDKWSRNLHCPQSFKQIADDLSLFPKIDMRRVNTEYRRRFNQPGSISLCHYTVIDNKIYRRTQGKHVGFKMFSDSILLTLARQVKLPDMEFLSNLGDWPLEFENVNPLPILSWCGSDETNDIVLPTYEMTESALETMGRQMLDMLSVQANASPRWEDKIAKGFWRGRDSRQERIDLVKMSIQNPELINASLTRMFFFPHDKNEVGELVEHISFFDFFKYRYQINVDGTVAAYRFPYLLAGNSVVFKQESNYYEHFYRELQPFTHYIPFKSDLSDLEQHLQWAKDNDDEAKRISRNAQNYARDYLQANHILCYYVQLFKEYAKLMVTKPKIYPDMELVPQPSTPHECRCGSHKVKEEL